jgi:putative transposase
LPWLCRRDWRRLVEAGWIGRPPARWRMGPLDVARAETAPDRGLSRGDPHSGSQGTPSTALQSRSTRLLSRHTPWPAMPMAISAPFRHLDERAAGEVSRRAKWLGIIRSSFHHLPRPVSEVDLPLMRRMDELHPEPPFAEPGTLRRLPIGEGHVAGRLHVAPPMTRMGSNPNGLLLRALRPPRGPVLPLRRTLASSEEQIGVTAPQG